MPESSVGTRERVGRPALDSARLSVHIHWGSSHQPLHPRGELPRSCEGVVCIPVVGTLSPEIETQWSSVHDLLVGAMSARVRSRSRGRGDGQEAPDVFAFVAPGESQQEEPPTDNQDIEPGRERERTPPIEVEGDCQEMDLENTGNERGDGSDVKEKTPPNPERAKTKEAGDGQP
ncbi:P antigen family member 4 isoform X2 [Papio anubis]|uniref:P antigen family member 4 isoform X2 n=1 Tax=Papio anubis TaxID=9555 RepID=UPI0004F21528|nr:P antigen family member 4 isoform X2 [Papio anubis]